jgi:hypothetical protein
MTPQLTASNDLGRGGERFSPTRKMYDGLQSDKRQYACSPLSTYRKSSAQLISTSPNIFCN